MQKMCVFTVWFFFIRNIRNGLFYFRLLFQMHIHIFFSHVNTVPIDIDKKVNRIGHTVPKYMGFLDKKKQKINQKVSTKWSKSK